MSEELKIREINENVGSGEILSFNDVETINKIREDTEDRSTLCDVLGILKTDIELRDERFDTDCIEDLYYGEELLPERLSPPKPEDSLEGNIKEKLRAVIVNEYRRLCRLTNVKFLDEKITHKELKDKTDGYYRIAEGLYPEE